MSARRKLVAGNWKLHHGVRASEELAEVGAEISKGVQALNGHGLVGRR